MKRLLVSVCIASCCLSSLVTSAADSTNTVESATRRGLVLVTRAASNWQQHKTCIKFKGHGGCAQLEPLKHALRATSEDFFMTLLCAKKNEVCVAGIVR